MARARLAGGYDFLSLLARLMETDVDPLARPAAPDEALRRDHAVKAAHFARSAWSDTYDIGFVRKLPRRSERVVFHDRVHYWQQVSTPALQLKFMSYLDKLRYGVSALGGRGEWVCGAVPHAAQDTAQGQADATEEMRVADANAQADWHVGTFDVTHIAGGALNRIDAATAMPLLMLPHAESETMRLPAYGAMMWFDASERVACVPFTALYLLESAAHISECLFAGEPLPRPAALEDPQDDLYLGAWEFWRRVHEHRYRDDASLAVSFLAAVDFAVVSHGLVPSSDSETQAELTSIPYRFGKLAYRAQGFEPLTLDGREPADAVARFQDGVCEWTGLPTQRQTLVTLSAFLTGRLLRSVGRHLGERELRNASRQLDRPLAQAGESLEEVWELIRTAVSEGTPSIGQDSLGEMLNATAYRLSHPGVLAVAHAYERQLSAALPLPATLHRGKMLLDEGAAGRVGWQGPYPRESVRLLTDAVGLTAIKPLLDHEPRCGFVADGLRCSYMGRGLGCPERGLTADERTLRQRTGLDDFCHWMHRAVLLGLAPGEAQQRWEACLREGDAQD